VKERRAFVQLTGTQHELRLVAGELLPVHAQEVLDLVGGVERVRVVLRTRRLGVALLERCLALQHAAVPGAAPYQVFLLDLLAGPQPVVLPLARLRCQLLDGGGPERRVSVVDGFGQVEVDAGRKGVGAIGVREEDRRAHDTPPSAMYATWAT